jgi:hypothetical protein
MANATAVLPPTTTDLLSSDDDEDSVATVPTGIKTINNNSEVKEYVIKFLFRPSSANGNADVARTHYAILQQIHKNFPDETVIFDNYGNKLHSFASPTSFIAYLRHFSMQYAKPNLAKKRNGVYMVHHRIHSSVPISEIRKHQDISALLVKVNTRMTIHQWKEDEVHISTLGFFVDIDPANHLQDEYTDRVRQLIATTMKRKLKKIPVFRLVFSSPFMMNSNNTRVSTKSYDLQVRQRDAKLMVELLRQTYQSNPTFVFHRLRHKNPQAYRNAIRHQNSFLSQSRIIPIQGITADMMFSFDLELRKLPGVHDVLRHKNTDTEGRWNLLTTETSFKSTSTAVDILIGQWMNGQGRDFLIDDSYPTPGLAFKNRIADSDSERSFASYMSACSSVYSLAETEPPYDAPPAPTIPSPQAWGTPSTTILASSTTPVSGLSTESTSEAEKVQKELSDIRLLLSKLEKSVQPVNMEQLVIAAAQVVIQAMASQSPPTVALPPPDPDPKTPARSSNKRPNTNPSPMHTQDNATSNPDAPNLPSNDDDL